MGEERQMSADDVDYLKDAVRHALFPQYGEKTDMIIEAIEKQLYYCFAGGSIYVPKNRHMMVLARDKEVRRKYTEFIRTVCKEHGITPQMFSIIIRGRPKLNKENDDEQSQLFN
jgi:hypothetical protein